MGTLTTRALRQQWRGQDRWLPDGGPRGAGRLVGRITREGVLLYYQYFCPPRRRRWLPLGAYDEGGQRGLSLPLARDRVAELSALYRSGITDLAAHLALERDAQARARQAAAEAARREREAAERSTLRQLLDAYVSHQEHLGKQSARDAKGILRLHVVEAAPELAAKKAADVTVDEFVVLIGRLAEAGKGRTSAKLRSYLHAAYQLAVESRTDPSAPQTLRAYGVTVNPIASIGALSKYSRARDRVLSAPELAAFLKRLDALPAGAQRDALQLGLLLGGQRPRQLLRVKPTDVDLSAGTIVLLDPKGTRAQPRRHMLPLVAPAAAILSRRLAMLGEGEPLFSSDGKVSLSLETLSVLVSSISRDMVKAKEAREPFQLRDLRRTAETMLASLGVSSDVRAQLQSHGLGGIQQRHYDRHDYALEKRAAVELWAGHLERLKAGEVATVTSIGQGRKPRADRRSSQDRNAG
ncbi:MAG: tyrosine-type recombinase/integrase [Steroidobacteraceae bacterium]